MNWMVMADLPTPPPPTTTNFIVGVWLLEAISALVSDTVGTCYRERIAKLWNLEQKPLHDDVMGLVVVYSLRT